MAIALAINRFELAVRAHETRGAQPMVERPGIEKEYLDSMHDLMELISAATAADPSEHEWVQGKDVGFGVASPLRDTYMCKRCGILKREGNKPCKGKAKITLRQRISLI
jgi:hypothetical protein